MFWYDLEAAILYLTRPRISGMAAAIENVGAAIVQWRRPTNGRRHFTGTRDLTRLKKWRSPSVQTKTIDLVIGILLHYKHSYTMMFYQFVLITTRLKHK